MSYVLIVISYLGRSAFGPQVSMQEFSSLARCGGAQTAVLLAVDRMNQSNFLGGVSRREILSAECAVK